MSGARQIVTRGNDPEPLGPLSNEDLGDMVLVGAQLAEADAERIRENIDGAPEPTPSPEVDPDVQGFLRLTKTMQKAGQLTQPPSLTEVPPAVLRLPEAVMVDWLRSVEAQREFGEQVRQNADYIEVADDSQARDRHELLEAAREALDESAEDAWDQAVYLSEEDGEAAEQFIREWAGIDPSAVTAFVAAYPRHDWTYLQDGTEQLGAIQERDQARQTEQQHAAIREAVNERWAELGQDSRWSGALEVAGELLQEVGYRPETPDHAREAVDTAVKVADAQLRTEASLESDPFIGQLAKMDQRLMEDDYLSGRLPAGLEPRHADLSTYRDAVVKELASRPDTVDSIMRRGAAQPGDSEREFLADFDAQAERAKSPNAEAFAEALAGSRAERAAEAKRKRERGY